MARQTNTATKTTKITMIPNSTQDEANGNQTAPPQLTPNDIAILYKLAQQATIKVSDMNIVSSVMDKCSRLLSSIK